LLVSEKNLARYRLALSDLFSWLVRNLHNPFAVEDLDALAANYKNEGQLSKSQVQ
jgi:hypothetical protein